jgi:hypothetical protein
VCGCTLLALTLPPSSVLAGAAVLAAGAVVRVLAIRSGLRPDDARVP